MAPGFTYKPVGNTWVRSKTVWPDEETVVVTEPVVEVPPKPYDAVFQAPKGNPPLCDHFCESLVFEQDGKQLYAGSLPGIRDNPSCLDDAKVVIDCANVLNSTRLLQPSTHEEWRFLEQYSSRRYTFSRISLDWTDGATLQVKPEFWVELWKALPEGKTVVCCLGGHGRTGTTLTALMMVAQNLDPFLAAMQCRAAHCNEAIETLGQHTQLDLLARHLQVGTSAQLSYHVLNAREAVKILSGEDVELRRELLEELKRRADVNYSRPSKTYWAE